MVWTCTVYVGRNGDLKRRGLRLLPLDGLEIEHLGVDLGNGATSAAMAESGGSYQPNSR